MSWPHVAGRDLGGVSLPDLPAGEGRRLFKILGFGHFGFDADDHVWSLEDAVEVSFSAAVSDPELVLQRQRVIKTADPGDLKVAF